MGTFTIADSTNLKIDHSIINSLITTPFGSRTFIGNSRLSDTSTGGGNGGNIICAGVYDQMYVFYPNTCPSTND